MDSRNPNMPSRRHSNDSNDLADGSLVNQQRPNEFELMLAEQQQQQQQQRQQRYEGMMSHDRKYRLVSTFVCPPHKRFGILGGGPRVSCTF